MSIFRPMLGAPIKDLRALRFPLFASLKLDGVRAIWFGKEFLSRTLKTIPNRELQKVFAQLDIPSGTDGELIFGEPNASDVYRKTNSAVMTINGSGSNIRFFTFDNCEAAGPFWKRNDTLGDIHPHVVKLDQFEIRTLDDLLGYEEQALKLGYEGLVLRAPEGRYKNGRSTFNEQWMLKMKRFADGEAVVIGFEELMHNANQATTDQRGYTKRSSHAEWKVAMGTLGSLVLQLGETIFRVGTGFSQADRERIWAHRDQYLGKICKFKSLKIGVKDAPRHPVFLGWRDPIDL